jgi:hypothetical protein
MPRVNIPITQLSQAGVAPPAQVSSDATNDHELAYNDGRVFIEVSNVNASPQSVTIPTPGQVSGLNIDDITVSVPATTGVRLIGPLSPGLVNQADGKVHIDVTIATDLKFRAYHL